MGYSDINRIPTAVFIYLLSYLDVYSLARVSQVAHKFIEFTEETSIIIKRSIENNYFDSEKLLILLQNRVNSLQNCKLSKNKLLLYEIIKPRVLIVRGFVAQIYDINKREWIRCTDLRRDRTFCSMTWLNGFVYCIGTHSVIASGTAERFNPYSNSWQSIESLPKKLRGMTSCTVNKKLLVTGGFDSYSNDISYNIYEYNSSDNKRIVGHWVESSFHLPYPRHSHACLYYEDKLWILGGISNFGMSRCVTLLDVRTNSWKEGPKLNRNRVNFSVFIINDELYAVGGDTDEYNDQSIEKYDRSIKVWVIITKFTNRIGYSSACYRNNIYIFAGDISGAYTFDYYDVITNTWASTFMSSFSREIPEIPSNSQAIAFPPQDISWS